jgi:hypothetical protein
MRGKSWPAIALVSFVLIMLRRLRRNQNMRPVVNTMTAESCSQKACQERCVSAPVIISDCSAHTHTVHLIQADPVVWKIRSTKRLEQFFGSLVY